MGALSALVMALSPGMSARAQEAEGSRVLAGTRLVEGRFENDGIGTARRLACNGRFCLWMVTHEVGACAAYRCANDSLVASDLEGKPLGASLSLDTYGVKQARFLDEQRVELVTWRSAETYQARDADMGVDPMSTSREVLKLARNGAKFTKDREASRAPAWKKQGPRRDTGRVKAGTPLPPLVSAPLTLVVSDVDEGGKQETLMGHEGLLRFWTQYPPSMDEYRMRTQGPRSVQ